MHSNKYVLLEAPFQHLRSGEKTNAILSFLQKDNSLSNSPIKWAENVILVPIWLASPKAHNSRASTLFCLSLSKRLLREVHLIGAGRRIFFHEKVSPSVHKLICIYCSFLTARIIRFVLPNYSVALANYIHILILF